MKFCPEHTQLSLNSAVEELLLGVVGDEAIGTSDKGNKGKVHAAGCNHVVGFFERKLICNLEKTPDISQGMNRGKKTAFLKNLLTSSQDLAPASSLRDENSGRESGEAVITSDQEMRVFIPVYQSTKPKGFVN